MVPDIVGSAGPADKRLCWPSFPPSCIFLTMTGKHAEAGNEPTSAGESAVAAAFAPVADLAAAEARARQLANTHYENFPVISLLLPRHLRQDFANIYAFCRIADDLGDEMGDRERSLELLEQLKEATLACFAAVGSRQLAVGSEESRDGLVRSADPTTANCQPPTASSALFVALVPTIRRHELPIQPFLDLIDAFQQDQRITRYDSFEQLLDYCRRSANPVGRLVLYLSGYRDEERQILSDKTCTALQLVNFWQDVRRDIVERDRIYIPADSMRRFGVSEEQIRAGRCDQNYRDLIRFEVDRTEFIFSEGDALLPMLKPSARNYISLFGRGGRCILDAIRRQDYDTLTHRPVLTKGQKGRLLLSTLVQHTVRVLLRGE
jgi:squalene synthase HpnC